MDAARRGEQTPHVCYFEVAAAIGQDPETQTVIHDTAAEIGHGLVQGTADTGWASAVGRQIGSSVLMGDEFPGSDYAGPGH